MKTILRSVPSRHVEHLIKFVDLIMVDRYYTKSRSFIDQLRLMAKLDDDILLIEDDIMIRDDQYEYILSTIQNHPDIVINFSSRILQDGMYAPTTFLVTRCVYFPRTVINEIVNHLDVEEFLSESHYDVALRKLLKDNYLSIYYTKATTDLHLPSEMKY